MKQLTDNNIVLAAIKRKKFVYAVVAALIAVGIVGLCKMNRDEFPTFDIKQGLVAAVYPGATAEEVKQQVTEPLEQLLFSCQEVERSTVKSFSKDGICYIYVDLTTPASTKDEVWSKIKLKLNAAKLTLPAGVAAIVVLDDFSETSALLVAMESDDKGYTELLDYAEDLCTRLRRIPALSKATVLGARTEEIAVTLDLERLTTYGISPSSLMLEYGSASLSTSGGSFDTDYITSPIHIANPVTNEQEIADRVIYTDPEGNHLRLKDIATIERRYRQDDPRIGYNGHNALVVNIAMRNDNNIVSFGREVEKVLEEFRATVPDSVRLSRITDQPKVVRTSILSFLRDLLISMLVVIMVMLMLFPMRSALIAGSGVPVCTAVTLAVMYFTGMQLNTVTLAALIVVLGMIVDDSIITMDGYMDKLGLGMDRMQAAVASARELFMPMFLATFAISAMFFPAKYIISGYLGDFIRSFPWIIAIALACSLVYAMLVVPSLEVRFITSNQPDKNAITRIQNRFFSWMQNIYNKAEAFCFRHAGLTILGGAAAIGLGILMFSQLNIQMMPKANRDCFAIEIMLDNNSSIRRTEQVTDSLCNILLARRDVTAATAFTGQSAPRFHHTYAPSLPGPDKAQVIVNTVSNKATIEILKEMEAEYEHLFPGAQIHFKQMDYNPTTAIEVTFKGDDHDALVELGDSLRKYMYGMTDVLKFIYSDNDNMQSCVNIRLRQDDASRFGVNKAAMSLALSGSFDGSVVANLYEDGRKVPVVLYNSGISRDMDYDDIASQTIPGVIPGVTVPLSQVADIEPDWRYSQLARYAGEDAVTVYADMKTGCSQPAAMKKIKAYIDNELDIPEGVSIKYGGLSASNAQVFPEIAWSFLAAVAILFSFLLIHFRKVSIASLTMVLSLLCLFGASFGLWAFGMDFTMTAVLGLISLVGIIVRNGIIMFEYAEQLRSEQGCSVREAAMLAGQRRMRPIFLTSCTTALGVLPMIISGDLLWMPMGLVICFGTMMSIILIVLIMPVSYWVVFQKADKNVQKTDNKI